MQLIYIQIDREAIVSRLNQAAKSENDNDDPEQELLEAEQLPLDPNIPLPYILLEGDLAPLNDTAAEADLEDQSEGAAIASGAGAELDWNGISSGIMYVALYEPKHEHGRYYRDFLLALEPELPHILQDRLRNQYDQRLWQHARDTVQILLFLLPDATWPLLELCYLYEQEAEQALLHQRFTACSEAWELAALSYKQLLERDDINAKCYFQLGYYYLQSWNYPAAYQAFVSSQQLALSPEHPLWAKCHHWLEKLKCFKFATEDQISGSEAEKAMAMTLALRWSQILADLRRAMGVMHRDFGDSDAPETSASFRDTTDLEILGTRALWLLPLDNLDELLRQQPDSGFLWYLRGLCLLFGHDVMTLRSLAEELGSLESEHTSEHGGRRGASGAFCQAVELGWNCPLEWQLPYYLGLSYYLEGSYREAEHSFLRVLQKDTEHCATLYWLEKLYGDLEDERSQQYLELLQVLDPSFPDLIQSFT